MIKLGCCGFPKAKQRYFREFKLVEIQQSFYNLIDPETAARWRSQAPQDFEFSLKAWQGITHPIQSPTWSRSRFKPLDRDRYGLLRPTPQVLQGWEHTLKLAKILRSKLVLIQCPAAFSCTPEHIQNANQFFSSITRDGLEIALELRGSWVLNPDAIQKLCDEFDLIHCVDPFWDQPLSRSPIAYLRLHGLGSRYNYSYRYTMDDLKLLLDKLAQLIESGRRQIYVLFNNAAMWENSVMLKQLLESWESAG